MKDVERTRIKEGIYKIDVHSGENPLYNILCTYAQFDPEIGYCQGMHCIVDLLYSYFQDEA